MMTRPLTLVRCVVLVLSALLVGMAASRAALADQRDKFRRPPMQQQSESERAAAAVGRVLFVGTELSVDRTLSCLTCHQPD